MVTPISRASIENTLPIFVRNVLRQNISDTQSPTRAGSVWIFKGQPEDLEFNPPFVYIDECTIEQDSATMWADKRHPVDCTMTIWVWARKMANRDSVANDIIETLWDKTSADADSQTILSQRLIIGKTSTNNLDGMISKFPKLVRMKRIVIEWRYDGE